MDMGGIVFMDRFQEIFNRIRDTQFEAIDRVAGWAAGAIAGERFAVVFGSGHSFLPVMDTFPRIGSYPGWMPIHEISSAYVATPLGNNGLRTALFVEKIPGFGRTVMENYRLDPRDIMVVISNSGVNCMGIEVALAAREQGVKTVALTSVSHSKANNSRHSSGKHLYEVCDDVIDNCVPAGDALVEIAGFPARVASVSTIANCIVMQTLSAQTASKLAARGYTTPVLPCINNEISPEQHVQMERMVDDYYAEQARRSAHFYK